MPDPRKIIFPATALLLGLGLFLAVIEIGIRVVVPSERWRYRDSTHDFRIDPVLGWVRGPNLDSGRLDYMTNELIRTRTNSDGLMPHDVSRPRRDGVSRVLLVGDSTIVGSGVDEEQRIHAQLQRQLQAGGIEVEVLNAGTEGWATDQAMLRMEQLIDLYDPDMVLHCICANDFAGNTATVFNGINKPRFELDGDRRLAAMPFQATEQLREYVAHRSLPTRLIQHSAFYRVLRPRITALRARLGNWEARNVLGLTDEWYYDPQALENANWELFSALIERMARAAAEREVEFAVYTHPAVGAVWDPFIDGVQGRIGDRPYDRLALENRIRDEVQAVGVRFVPLVDYFAGRQERGPFHLSPNDPHCNSAGYELQAEALAALVGPRLLGQGAAGDGGE